MTKHKNCPGPAQCQVPKFWLMCDEKRKEIGKRRAERADPLEREGEETNETTNTNTSAQ